MVDTRNEELSPVKRALLELREMRARLDELQDRQHEPIAIIGAGLRFPGGANDLESFWRLLRDGVDAITEVPPDRWDINAYYDPDPMKPGKMSTRFGGFLDGIDLFDPQFFGISPREAASIDPQQRLLLEVTWEALENAGQSPDRLFGSQTGVFVGISHSDYLHMIFKDINQIDVYSTTGSALSVAGGRLSYVLGLQGPNISIDTACSSSLVAVHLAVQSLRQRESDAALAGGVGLILMPEINVNFSKSQMMAADGRCKTFDAAADGYVRGEGCGMIVLKRLSDALADGDHILAVIRGSAINQDGRSGGLTAPNGPSQESVISAALANARVKPEDVTYIEAHGTGTSLGDPIEVQALGAVFGAAHSADNPLMIGSVKTNMGHLEAAAGIAGLLKVVLALQHREIPPHLNLKEPNPYIPWAQYPITVPTARTPWMPPVGKRLAGVSSFGFSGTNAHVILEEAPLVVRESAPVERPLHLLTLSARSPQALAALAGRYEDFFAENSDALFADVCYTAAAGRAHFPHRLALVAESAQEAREKLAAYAAGQTPLGLFSGQAAGQPEAAFLFTGHGSQYLQMGRELYDTQPVFRAAIDRCDELLRPYLERSLLDALYPEAGQPSLMDGMAYTQPALFAIQIALADLWRSWGVEPTMVAGHSVGEYAAACVAGVFSLEDGLKLVAARGRLMESLPETGQMVAVFADENTVAQAVAPYADRVSIAVINGPQNIVISGAAEAVEAVVEILKQEKIKSRRLAVAQASHSPLIDPMLDEFERVAQTVTYAEPNIALISCTTGQIVEPGEVTNAAYWRRHIRQPVRFATAMETLYGQGLRVFVEIGPNPTLLALGQRNLPENVGLWLPSLREGVSDWTQMLESAGQLYAAGARLDWEGFDRDYARRRLPLPTYPFQRASYWADVARVSAAPSAPVWKAVLAAGQHQAQQGPLDLAVQTYPQRWDCLDRLTTAHILDTLGELGAFAHAGEAYTLDDLLSRFGILPIYHNLMRRWLKKLVSLDLLAEHERVFVCSRPLPTADLDTIWDEAHRVFADLPFVLDYLGRCGSKLTAVITGVESPLETLFPGGSFALAEDLYQHWSLSRYYAGIARAVLEAVVRTLPPGRTLRVLEIGAGTGATTASLLPALPPERTVYTFTDVSDLFLAQSSQKFRAYPFVHYALLDIEQPPEAQGFSPHGYDVIVAANVLHATRDLNQTLQNVQSLLAPSGLLLLDETTEHLPWFDMTTGLIGGWQRFEDNLRGDNPLLKPAQWATVLEANGFSTVQAWPEPGAATEILAQHIIVAQTGQAGYAEYGGADATWQPERAYDDGQPAAPENLAQEFMRQLQAVLPDERHDLLVDYVRQRVARVLRLDASQTLDRHQRLLDMGLDSLMALELRALLSGGLDLSEGLPATLVFDYPTIDLVATYLEGAIGLTGETDEKAAAPAPDQTAQAARAAEIADLSDEEVEALLLKKLRR
ncbi:MAG: acyltransferase domain-containing protein [Chloroflexi bacterium]|nr:acyltransferase domain-containing protein [Chloroflexota bacterium]MDL1883140.1 acyltransferase domain-containing protein [Anaerolineae bacterium CFX8]